MSRLADISILLNLRIQHFLYKDNPLRSYTLHNPLILSSGPVGILIYADMHLMYGLASRNYLKARRLYAEKFPNRALPERRMFERIDLRLRETGYFLAKRCGEDPVRTARTVAVEEVLNAVDNEPSTSVRKLSREHNVSKSVVHRISFI